ncbi:MAG: polynucleotide adenylyltransferase PcnB [Methylococcales symbiont of Hymedesmia sp. n. MRB-2018]|nr:MAG: polynucleotide adenylyltransferase PcnB [Methylococcales symbiont of Hymedesmia sp. n. MRB-2018]
MLSSRLGAYKLNPVSNSGIIGVNFLDSLLGRSAQSVIKGTTILNFIKKIFPRSGKATNSKIEKSDTENSVRIYSRSEHNISRSQISENALKVLYRLKKTGYEAFLVGGCVRDLLLGYEPKDFDVVTDASPEEVRKVFRNCRLIGRRFRLAHVYFGREIIEVATFRGSDDSDLDDRRVHEDGRLLRDNVFGSIEDDIWRRDFTVNALYYNIRDFSVLDYTSGMEDHSAGILKLIGDPVVRYKEDPVRMLRAVRFSVKLGFKLEAACEQALIESCSTLKGIPAARLYDEVLKLFLSGKALQTFEMLRHYGLFAILFPQTEHCLAELENNFPRLFVAKALENSDKRISQGKSVTPYFFLSAFLWESVQIVAKQNIAQGMEASIAYQNAASPVISAQVKSITIPKRVTQSMREVWLLQLRFNQRVGVRPFKLLSLPRFRAAYDFLLLRAETGEVDTEIAEWWTKFQDVDEAEQKKMTRPLRSNQKSKKKKPALKKENNENSVDSNND